MRILVVNGPNINLLGTREPEIYGTLTLDKINEEIKKLGNELGVEIITFQSNIEGEIVNVFSKIFSREKLVVRGKGPIFANRR